MFRYFVEEHKSAFSGSWGRLRRYSTLLLSAAIRMNVHGASHHGLCQFARHDVIGYVDGWGRIMELPCHTYIYIYILHVPLLPTHQLLIHIELNTTL